MVNKVLIVDDDLTIRNSLKRLIDKEGYVTILADNGEDAIRKVLDEDPDIIFLDLRLPKMDGLTVLKKIKEISENAIVFLFSAYGTFNDVVKAVKLGAFDYLQKPYNNEEIKINLLKAQKAIQLREEVNYFRSKESTPFVVISPEFRHIIGIAKKVAKSSDTAVLIEGETGVGKQIIARFIHDNSPNRNGPFLNINCAAIPHELLESELFGYEKGAFTGANGKKRGLLEVADCGTLHLDEIGDLSINGQVKLLHVLENKEFLKVGGTTVITSHARIVASTNKDLELEVKKGNFRKDLFYRLSVIKIKIPPLRERKQDIIPLAKFFLEGLNIKFNRNLKEFSKRSKTFLLKYEWPGNVRELKNLMERAVLLASKNSYDIDLFNSLNGYEYTDESIVIRLGKDYFGLDQVNKFLIEESLRRCIGNKVKAAKILGLSRSTLRYRIKKYNIVVSRAGRAKLGRAELVNEKETPLVTSL
jgi:DNA-binding NtrC family response regulator